MRKARSDAEKTNKTNEHYFYYLIHRYFHGTAFKPNKKRQELADRLFSVFDQDVFSSKVLFLYDQS